MERAQNQRPKHEHFKKAVQGLHQEGVYMKIICTSTLAWNRPACLRDCGHAHRNIWALFVAPGFEGQGIGRGLLDVMVTWLFAQGRDPVWLVPPIT
jgi:GNAT superfamily N-acetyltransferase